ncbi:hypothetical protein B2H94_08680 [Clostridium sporogenes]|uniref:DUF4365 domain-containing protein n=1 Tax=Clostridium sporogenes TaxID=1509 RepID=A0ABD6RUY3_CLOSG|nr:DUF4365 domain-containing protein [Clostridium sporogenes]OSB19165.1 hypothetical protein B2H94_08680 [Clostridium sporogenes]
MDSGNIGRLAVKELSSFMERYNIQQHNCYERDEIGIDAYYEIFGKDKCGILFAAQIKGGNSYFKNEFCFYYDEGRKHINKWLNFNMPVILFIFDEISNRFHWLDIKNYILNNPQNDKKGYTFKFPKLGNELDENNLNYIISKFTIDSSQSCYYKAKYYYDSFDNLAKLFLNETNQISENDALLEASIRNWLSNKGFNLSDDNFIKRLINSILYNIRGIGEIGFLLNDDKVRMIDVFENKIFVTSDTELNKGYYKELKYDINKCFDYFSKYKKTNSSISEIPFNDMEIILMDKPVSQERVIHVHKKERAVRLFECNSNNRINLKFNQHLEKIINEYSNILIVGTKFNHTDMIISAITSLFSETDKISLIEDRKEICVLKGQVNSIYPKNNDYMSMVNAIRKGIDKENDRVILNIGNYNVGENVFPNILETFTQRKGCIALFEYKIEYFEDINRELMISLYRYNHVNDEQIMKLIRNIDYIIKIDGIYELDGYMFQICKNNNFVWDVVEEYIPERN